MTAEEMGDLFWAYARADNPDDKEKLGLKFANALTDTLRRLDARAAVDASGEKAGLTQAAEGSELLRLKSLNAELREGLDLLRGCIQEGGVPRYTAIPGAALNSIIEEVIDPLLSRTT